MWPGNGGRSTAPAPVGAATSAAASAAASSASAAAAAAAEESIVPTLCCCICTELFEQPMVVSCCGTPCAAFVVAVAVAVAVSVAGAVAVAVAVAGAVASTHRLLRYAPPAAPRRATLEAPRKPSPMPSFNALCQPSFPTQPEQHSLEPLLTSSIPKPCIIASTLLYPPLPSSPSQPPPSHPVSLAPLLCTQLVEQARIIGVTRQQRLATLAVTAALPASHVTVTSASHDCSQTQAQRDTDAHAQSCAGARVNTHGPSPSQANLTREASAHAQATASAASGAGGGVYGFSSAGSCTVSSISGGGSSSSSSSSNGQYRSSLQGSRLVSVGPLTSQSAHSTTAGVTASSPSPHPHSPEHPSACAPVTDVRQDHTAISIPDCPPPQLTSSTHLVHHSLQPNFQQSVQQNMQQSLAQGQASEQRQEDLAGAERSGVDSFLPDLVVRLSGFGAAADMQSAQQQPGQQQLPETLAHQPQVLTQEQRHQQRQQHRQHRHQQQQQQQQQRMQQLQQLQQGRCCCPSPYALAVRGLLACGSSGRRLLLLCARARRWFLVNEPRIRFSLFLAVSALLVFYLRVQEEEYARVTRYP
ncbi:unnamed protein product [Closterium sp. NIES-53]